MGGTAIGTTCFVAKCIPTLMKRLRKPVTVPPSSLDYQPALKGAASSTSSRLSVRLPAPTRAQLPVPTVVPLLFLGSQLIVGFYLGEKNPSMEIS